MSDPVAPPPSGKPPQADNSPSDDVYQLNSPWNTIIVNQLPKIVDYNKLISLFSRYGEIDDTYLCKGTNSWIRAKHERLARITYSNEEDASKVWEVSKNKLIKYDDHVLAITLASEDYSPIQNLPDICLREIFQRVNEIRDKFRVEMVCKRWKDNARCCWSNIDKIFTEDWREIRLDYDIWRVIVSRVKDSLETVIAWLNDEDSHRCLVPVAEHCKHLKRLYLEFYGDDNYALCAPYIHAILNKNGNLRQVQVYFHRPNTISMDFMKVLPLELEEIDVRVDGDRAPIPATVALSRFQNLKILRLHNCMISDQNLIDNVGNLEQLSLVAKSMAESLLLTLLRNNEGLKYLRIVMNKLRDASFQRITQLPKLQVLVMRSRRFTDAYMGEMSKLKGLMCYKCPSITDEGIRSLFNSHCEIKELGIVNCPITLESISTAREWTERTGQSLKLWVSAKFFKEYPAAGGQNTEKFKVVQYYKKKSHEVDWNSEWGLELVE